MTDFIIQQGTDSGFQWPIEDYNGAPYDTTGWAVKAQVKSVTTGEILHTWSTELGNAIVEPGFVTLIWTSEDSDAWTWHGGRYQMEAVDDNGRVLRIDQGYVSVSREIVK